MTLSRDLVGDIFLLLSRVAQGFRACGRDKGAIETDEVCDRPLVPFAFASGCYYVVVFIGRTKGTLTKKPSIKIN